MNKGQKINIRDFLVDIADNEIVQGKSYNVRIEISDGGENSYIGLCVDIEDFRRKVPVTRGVRFFRHTNSVNRLINKWEFGLGDVCNAYADYPKIPIKFSSYGKSADDAEVEAQDYIKELKKRIRKITSDYKIQIAEETDKEREQLLARLADLDKEAEEKGK